MSDHLVGASELAAILGVSRQRVAQLATAYIDFPEPEVELAAGRIWSRQAIEGWLATHPERKPGRGEGADPAFDRFTDRARDAFVLAQGCARRLRHGHLGCEHVLIGLLEESEGIAGRALAALGVTTAQVDGLLRELVGPNSRESSDNLPFTRRQRQALAHADKASAELGHEFIGTEHLLLGILREGENVGCRLLIEAGVDLASVRLKLLELMGFPQRRAGPPDETLRLLDQVIARLATIDERLAALEQRSS